MRIVGRTDIKVMTFNRRCEMGVRLMAEDKKQVVEQNVSRTVSIKVRVYKVVTSPTCTS